LVPPVGQGWGRLGSHRTIGLLGNWRGDVTRPQRPGAGTPPRPVPAPKPAPNSRTPSPRSMPLIRAATVRPPFMPHCRRRDTGTVANALPACCATPAYAGVCPPIRAPHHRQPPANSIPLLPVPGCSRPRKRCLPPRKPTTRNCKGSWGFKLPPGALTAAGGFRTLREDFTPGHQMTDQE